ncbi:MAG: hypothetical protein L7H00_06155 [Vulcanisaeta sp.]|nr:hypothetical protein [Vulcanisaeta sp.]
MVLVPVAKFTVPLKTLARGTSNAHKNKNLLSIYGMQLFFKGGITWSTKDFIIRNPPLPSILDPTERQKAIRYAFGYIAHHYQEKASAVGITVPSEGKKLVKLPQQGRKLPGGAEVPVVAAVIQAAMKNRIYTVEPEKRDTYYKELRHSYKRTWHSYKDFASAYELLKGSGKDLVGLEKATAT